MRICRWMPFSGPTPPPRRPRVHADVRVPRVGENELAHTPFAAEVQLRGVDLRALGALAGVASPFSGRIDEARVEASGTSTRLVATVDARTAAESAHAGSRPILPAAPAALHGRLVSTRQRVVIDEARLTLGSLVLALTGSITAEPRSAELHAVAADGTTFSLPVGDPAVVGRELRVEATATRARRRAHRWLARRRRPGRGRGDGARRSRRRAAPATSR